MLKTCLAIALCAVACSKEKDAAPPPPPPVAPAPTPAPPPTPATPDATVTAAVGSGSAAAGSGSAGSGEATTGGFDFDKLSHEDKMKFMRTKMVPAMKETFQAFDAKKYANFGCKTCHGKDPQKNKYKMPNPELPALDFKLLEQGKQKPNIAEWMSKTVKPQVAQILERPQMSKDHPDGFGCLECHTEKK